MARFRLALGSRSLSAALGVAAVGIAVVALQGCPKKEEPTGTGTQPPTAAPTPAPTAPTTGGGTATAPTPTPNVPSGPPGTIAGVVKFTGKAPVMAEVSPKPTDPVCLKPVPKDNSVVVSKDGGLQDVLVRITVGGAKGEAKGGPTFTQEGCMYKPRVAGAMPGQEVTYVNSDKTMHNVQVLKGTETVFNTGQPAASSPIKKPAPEENGVLKIKCSVHPWMTAFLIVTDHPFFAVTGEDGKFEIKDVPSGKYKVEAWHSQFGLKTTDLTIEASKAADPKFTYDGTEKPSE